MKRGSSACWASSYHLRYVLTIEFFHNSTCFYMAIEPARQGEVCRELGEIGLKWDKISPYRNK